MNTYYITVRSGQPFYPGYFKVTAENETKAKASLTKVLGYNWCQLYYPMEDLLIVDSIKRGSITASGELRLSKANFSDIQDVFKTFKEYLKYRNYTVEDKTVEDSGVSWYGYKSITRYKPITEIDFGHSNKEPYPILMVTPWNIAGEVNLVDASITGCIGNNWYSFKCYSIAPEDFLNNELEIIKNLTTAWNSLSKPEE